MNTLPPGAELGFEYQAYDGATDLYVAMVVKNITTGTPVLVSQIIMEHDEGGNYIGFFEPTEDNQYSIRKAVFTTDDYDVEDTSRPCGSETFICKDLSTGGSSSGGAEFIKMKVCENQSVKMYVKDDSIKMKVGC